jgi:hypothetical protein
MTLSHTAKAQTGISGSGPQNFEQLSERLNSKDTSNLTDIQARWISRLYALSLAIARLAFGMAR